MVDHLQSRVTPWRQYASHVKVRGTSLKMDVIDAVYAMGRAIKERKGLKRNKKRKGKRKNQDGQNRRIRKFEKKQITELR